MSHQQSDDFLDEALDILEQENVTGSSNTSNADEQTFNHVKGMEDALEALLEEAEDENENSHSHKNASEKNLNSQAIDETLSKLLKGLASQSAEDDGDDIPDMDKLQMGEDIMEQMMNDFSKMTSNKGDFDDIVDGMMKQLLAKELMYEPMKNVCDRFPIWLADSKEKLTEEEYIRYGTQYQYFQRIVDVYENDPGNFTRLQELMTEIQEFGQPPAEIIKELAPGLDVDDIGFGQIPGMPDPSSIFSNGPDGEPQCPTM